jgi:single-strand DNA-binding protein
MAATNINRVILTGNLTRDPELRSLQSGRSVCSLRVAVNTRRKDQSGDWVDKPNYLSVSVWGAQGENCARYLAKGRAVAIDGRLEWREWEAKDGSGKRETVDIVADSVQFIGGRDQATSSDGGSGFQPRADVSATDVPVDTSDFTPAAAPTAPGLRGDDDDIPF